MKGVNVLKFQVMSREKARQYSFREDINDCVIISISEAFEPANQFADNPHIKDICCLNFDDVEGDTPNHMVREDAEKIIEFVNKHVDDVDEIVVHCFAGVSRSAGVCAALMQILTGDDSDIFNNPRFCPNMHCYRLVMEAYYGSYDQEAADEKIRRNIAVWRKAQGLD